MDIYSFVFKGRDMGTDEDWAKWGESDPYFGVLSDNRFRKETIDQYRDEFFSSGEAMIATRMATVERLFGPLSKGSAVDFGCGVGRLAIPLARRFDHVTGIDISSGMIAESQENCAKFNVNNCRFLSAVDAIERNSIDYINSDIVLQHIPPKKGLKIISSLVGLLRPGSGVIALQMTTKRRIPVVKEIVYSIKHNVPGARYLFNIVQGKNISEPLMQMNDYPIDEVVECYRSAGVKNIFLEPTFGSSFGFIVYGKHDTEV